MPFPLVFSGFLLAMQAAGTVIDWKNTQDNIGLINKGRELENAQYQANLDAVRVESEEASLNEMKQLRQNIGTQIANNAAKGTSSASGTAQSLINSSMGAFNSDERTRRINLLTKESNLRAANVLSGLHTLQSETQLGQAFNQRLFDTLPISTAANAFGKTKLGKQWGFGLEEHA